MANPYTSVTVANYNANPPSDDGSQTPANQLTWGKHKSKLADPLKTALEAINTNVLAALGKIAGGVTILNDDYTVLAGDQGLLLVMTVASKTITTPAAGTVTEPFRFAVLNNTAGDLTLDGNASETIDGSATITVPAGRGCWIETDGSNWFTAGKNWPESVVIARPMGPPNGRLTLTSATPVLSSDTSGQSTVYFTPYNGCSIWLYDGSNWKAYAFSELSQALSDTTKSPAATVENSVYDLFAWLDGSTLRCTRGPKWSKTATITVTIANPGVVTWTGHGLATGMPVRFTTTGALPTGISANTDYFVTVVDANSFRLSTTLANCVAGTFVTTTGSQSGTHTGENATTSRGTGAGSSELVRVNGVQMNANNITNGPAAQRGVHVGTIGTDGSNQLNMQFTPAAASGGTGNRLDVWNRYNQEPVAALNRDSANSWNYSSSTPRAANNNANNRISFVLGEAQAVQGAYVALSAGTSFTGIGLDAHTAFAGAVGLVGGATGSSGPFMSATALYAAPVAIGAHALVKCEAAGGSATFYGDNNAPTTTQEGLTVQLRM